MTQLTLSSSTVFIPSLSADLKTSWSLRQLHTLLLSSICSITGNPYRPSNLYTFFEASFNLILDFVYWEKNFYLRTFTHSRSWRPKFGVSRVDGDLRRKWYILWKGEIVLVNEMIARYSLAFLTQCDRRNLIELKCLSFGTFIGAMTLSITTFRITTFSIMTLSITILSITTFSIMTLSINDTQHNYTLHRVPVAECCNTESRYPSFLCRMSLCSVSLWWMQLCWELWSSFKPALS